MLVLLDRDGVLNVDVPPHGVTSLDMLEIYPFAGEAVRLFNDAGWKVAIITNQSAVGKGLLSEAGLRAIHTRLQAELHAQAGAFIDAIYHCPDHPNRPTHRRKPNAGMVVEALRDFGASAADTPMIGDDVRDVEAALSSGCTPFLVRTGKGRSSELRMQEMGISLSVFTDILDAARHLTLHYRSETG
jgi:D-glycero-D-manno-heptose 1,7-bisphosphate phosphatase